MSLTPRTPDTGFVVVLTAETRVILGSECSITFGRIADQVEPITSFNSVVSMTLSNSSLLLLHRFWAGDRFVNLHETARPWRPCRHTRQLSAHAHTVNNNKLQIPTRSTHLAQSFFSQHFRAIMGVKQSICCLAPPPPPSPAPAPAPALPPPPPPRPPPDLPEAPGHSRVPNLQFRVLIIGRANAGKTSILQKVCDTTESPEIRRSGHQVRAHC